MPVATLRPGTRPPWVIAHRGASAERPENTLAAFDRALGEGCDGIELDVQLSRDGVPVVYHDRTLYKAGGGLRPVWRVDAAEIGRLDAGRRLGRGHAGQRVPTLERVLRRYARRTTLLIELKARPRDRKAGVHLRLADAVVDRVRSLGLERRVMVLCFDLDTLRRVAERGRRIPRVLNLEAPRRPTAALSRALAWLDALSVDVRTLSPAIVEAAHAAGRPVLTYTCNTPRAVRRALAARVDAVMADRPGWLRTLVEAADGR